MHKKHSLNGQLVASKMSYSGSWLSSLLDAFFELDAENYHVVAKHPGNRRFDSVHTGVVSPDTVTNFVVHPWLVHTYLFLNLINHCILAALVNFLERDIEDQLFLGKQRWLLSWSSVSLSCA